MGRGRRSGRALRDAATFTIYTPGSTSGVPLNIVGGLRRPAEGSDPEIAGDEIEGFVSGLLNLVGIEADPLSSREHILLSNLVGSAWASGSDLDLPTLVAQAQDPPLRKLGVYELDAFYPAKERAKPAMNPGDPPTQERRPHRRPQLGLVARRVRRPDHAVRNCHSAHIECSQGL